MTGTWEALGDPIRREIIRQLAQRDLTAGEIAAHFSISRPGVSKHLRVLREARLVTSTAEAQRRVYALDPTGLDDVESWCTEISRFWTGRLGALGTEIARGKRDRARTERPAEGRPPNTHRKRTA